MRRGQGGRLENRAAPLHVRPGDDVNALTVAVGGCGPEAEKMEGEVHAKRAGFGIGTDKVGVEQ